MIKPLIRIKNITAFLNLIILMSLSTTSCASPTPIATLEPTLVVTDTPVATFTSEIPSTVNFPAVEIDALVYKMMVQGPLAGIALGVQYKGVFYEQGYGLADVTNQEPVTTQTLFKIASLTKAITAAAILELEQEGQLSINDPISRFFPMFQKWQKIFKCAIY